MNCQKFKHYIHDIETRDLKKLDANARRHLDACATCQADFAAQTKLRQLLGNLEVISAPPDFDARLTARLTAAQFITPARLFFDSIRFTPSLASVALAVVFVAFLVLVLIGNLRQTETAQSHAGGNNVAAADASRPNINSVTSPVVATISEAANEITDTPEVVASNHVSKGNTKPVYKKASTPKRITPRRETLPLIPSRPASNGTADQASRASDITRVAGVEIVEANGADINSLDIPEAASGISGKSKLEQTFERYGIHGEAKIVTQPDTQMVLNVTRVREQSIAAEADVRVGDLIETVNDISVGKHKEIELDALTSSQILRVHLRRTTQRLEINLKFPE